MSLYKKKPLLIIYYFIEIKFNKITEALKAPNEEKIKIYYYFY